MELPGFDGSDPIAWLGQAEQYFLVHHTADEHRVSTALIAMSGKAMFWAQWLLRRSATIAWPEFSKEVIARFGDSSAVNAYEALHLTRQTGSLEDYLSLFEERVAQLPVLPAEHYLGTFLGGLQPSIRDRLPDSEMTDVFAAIRAAHRIARSSKSSAPPSRPSFNPSAFPRPTTTFQLQSPPGDPPPPRQQATFVPRNSRRLTVAQQEEYKAKGLCFRCSGKYGPLHKCLPKTLAVMLDSNDDDPDPQPSTLHSSSKRNPRQRPSRSRRITYSYRSCPHMVLTVPRL